MSAYHAITVAKLLIASVDEVVGQLAINQSGIQQTQLNAWHNQVRVLKVAADELSNRIDSAQDWTLLFEYEMLRIQRRIDLVLIATDVVFSIEFKMGATGFNAADRRQTEDYAFDLRDFHAGSRDTPIVPVLCSSKAPSLLIPHLDLSQHVSHILLVNETNLGPCLVEVWQAVHREDRAIISALEWDKAAYSPVPTIIETAEKLYGANDVREIHEALAEHINLTKTTDRLIELIADAQAEHKHRICFVTGVPGSGKTLTGLNAVHDPRFREDGRGAGAFLSGNTPLVAVLREALPLMMRNVQENE